MRLDEFELKSIKELALKTFGNKSRVYIFGSRVDDKARGGDIDIYVEAEVNDNLFRKKIDYLVELKMTIGDQKIDLVVSKDKNLLIEKQALKKRNRNMKKDLIDIFNANLNECLKHKEKINIAKKYLLPVIPLEKNVYSSLDEIKISFIDQLVFRFSKLQDTMGEKIFPMILILSKENVKRKTFIDIVNRIEELGILYKKDWFNLRESRNKIAHEYSENVDDTIESLNAIFEDSEKLVQLFDNTFEFCKEKFEITVKS